MSGSHKKNFQDRLDDALIKRGMKKRDKPVKKAERFSVTNETKADVKQSAIATTPAHQGRTASDDALTQFIKAQNKPNKSIRKPQSFSFSIHDIAKSYPISKKNSLTDEEQDALQKLLKAPGISKPHDKANLIETPKETTTRSTSSLRRK